MKTVTVKKDEATPEPDEIIAKEILDIDAAMKRLNAGPLRRKAIQVLIQNNTTPRLAMGEIEIVLRSLETLKTTYLKSPAAPTPADGGTK